MPQLIYLESSLQNKSYKFIQECADKQPDKDTMSKTWLCDVSAG